ncbi:hypothetical protein ODD08_000277 [Salmonella enterica]|nr:hypothetical protein [Salmonella enterica]
MKFIYSGPASGVTLADGSEVLMWPNTEVELPEELDYTQTLLALRHLTPVEEASAVEADVAVETTSEPQPEPQPVTGKKEKGTANGS